MKQLIYLSLASLMTISMTGCIRCEEPPEPEFAKRYLVDKIYDYNHNLVAVYEYDAENRLVKRTVTNPALSGTSEAEFYYQNNRVHEIKLLGTEMGGGSYSRFFTYNEHGQLVGESNSITNLQPGPFTYFYTTDGKLSYITHSDTAANHHFNYFGGNNVKQVKYYVKGGPIWQGPLEERFQNYTYDTGKKPSFGIDYLLSFEPLPLFGGEATIERNASANNMTGIENGTTWVYTYNANGLPATIETKWAGVTTLEPMMLRLTYKAVAQQ